jgi:hypothetical protein
MSLNAAAIQFLLDKGLTGDDLLALARALESEKKQSAAAKRQARYREKNADKKAEGVTSDVTSDVTRTPKSNIKPIHSEANASVGDAPTSDPVKQVFDLGVALLTEANCEPKNARSLLGKWRKEHGEAKVLQALLDCRAKSISNPVEWLSKRFHGSQFVSATGYQYRGDAKAVMREAEKRADWNVYYSAKALAEDAA